MSPIRRAALWLCAAAVVVAAAAAAERPVYGPTYEDLPANYKFRWEVKDDYSGQDFGQEEARSGYNTDGEYSVLLPDGRKQIVSYTVLDDKSGFVADVRYEGETDPNSYAPPSGYKPRPHPAPKPAYREPKAYEAPKPFYKPSPRPAYKPSPKPVYSRPHYDPRPAYKPAPKPAPTYTTAAPKPAPYSPRPTPAAYKPVPRTYGPVYNPTEAPATTAAPVTAKAARVYQPTSARAYAEKVRRPISAYKQKPTEAPEPALHADEAEGAPPTYNPATVKKRRMKYTPRLNASSSNKVGSLFYGAVKGRVRAPKRGATKYDPVGAKA